MTNSSVPAVHDAPHDTPLGRVPLELALHNPALQEVLNDASRAERNLTINSIDAARPLILAGLATTTPLLVVTATGHEGEELTAELATYLGDGVAYFPSWETLPHERLSPSIDTVGRRLEVLHRLQLADHPNKNCPITPLRVVVAAARSLIQPLQGSLAHTEPFILHVDQEIDFAELPTILTGLYYERVDLVARRGDFAVRGGIVDIFPATAEHPVRIEFWGDEISDIRTFAVADQRTIPDADLTWVAMYPCSELLMTEDMEHRAAKLSQDLAGYTAIADMLDKLSHGIPVTGREAFIPALVPDDLQLLPSFLPAGAITVVCDQEKIRTRTADLTRTCAEFLDASWENAADGGEAPIDLLNLGQGAYRTLREVHEDTLDNDGRWWVLNPPGMLNVDAPQGSPLHELSWTAAPAPRGDLTAINDLVEGLHHRLHTTDGTEKPVFLIGPASTYRRLHQQLRERDIVLHQLAPGYQPAVGKVNFLAGNCRNGVELPELLILSEPDLTGSRVGTVSSRRCRVAKRRNAVDPLALKAGDLVVHDQHGIGRFVEMTERTIKTGEGTSRREYLVIEYAPSKRGQGGDRLYVPMEQLDQLSRYVGGEQPALSKMGGSDWKNTKRKARKAVREIAGELVQLYAARQAAPGHAFAPDTPWQQEMEDAFPYVETEDQLHAIDDVKNDMEKPTPMDRVVVGDVGYGKTEVAMRAAFKAVQDGTQVVVLVPTTLLAQQHLETFSERMAGFPVTVKGLSRFTSPAESQEILEGLRDGTVDIVIGTHRLLQPGVQWKNLGLVIVDEEQRFGVEHKEHIKALRTHVDVLTLSATPIPRTLEMSLAGIREMSTILTPPEDRQPILTYVGAYDPKQVAAAIRRELLRDGQVFFVHNKVSDIDAVATQLGELVPEARIAVAHGQMSEQLLEQTVDGFWNHEWDVLVCTTIVETGLDISNANTLIVDHADRLGLSQMHQLRGRVGRSRERGYAYFLYPAGKPLTTVAYDRLKTIAHNNDLGAGMAVAMKDLELRGAGNVLGAEQSGHIAGVGFDLYVRLVGEAVDAFRAAADGKAVEQPVSREVRVELPVDAHIPASYIEGERLRLEAYRKIAQAGDRAHLAAVTAELEDRYGAIPDVTQRLFSVALLRQLAQQHGITDIGLTGSTLRISPLALLDSQQVRLRRLYPQARYRATVQQVAVPLPRVGGKNLAGERIRDDDLLQWVADLITGVKGIPRISLEPPRPEESSDNTDGSSEHTSSTEKSVEDNAEESVPSVDTASSRSTSRSRRRKRSHG